jgi:hypothetical protein
MFMLGSYTYSMYFLYNSTVQCEATDDEPLLSMKIPIRHYPNFILYIQYCRTTWRRNRCFYKKYGG